MNNQNAITDDELKIQIRKALTNKYPVSLTELGHLMGWRNVRVSSINRIRALIPGLEELLRKNVVLRELSAPSNKAKRNTAPMKIAKVPRRNSKYPRHPQNPYRKNSGYGLAFDILASHIEGMRRDVLEELYAKASGKKVGNGATWDVRIVCGANEDGSAHRSCKCDGYWVERHSGGFLKLHFRQPTSNNG